MSLFGFFQTLWLSWFRPGNDFAQFAQVCRLFLSDSGSRSAFLLLSAGLFENNTLILAMGISLGAFMQFYGSLIAYIQVVC
jgi:hypothetical protein